MGTWCGEGVCQGLCVPAARGDPVKHTRASLGMEQGVSLGRCAPVCPLCMHLCARTLGARLCVPGCVCPCLHVPACARVCAVLHVPCMCIPTCARTYAHLYPPTAPLLLAIPWQRVPRGWPRYPGQERELAAVGHELHRSPQPLCPLVPQAALATRSRQHGHTSGTGGLCQGPGHPACASPPS